jgi:hypothetical protein
LEEALLIIIQGMVRLAREVNPDITITIKQTGTPYPKLSQ